MSRPRKFTVEQVTKLRELAPTHCSVEIAEMLGMRLATISYLCNKYGIPLGKIDLNQDKLTAIVDKEIISIYAKEADVRNTTVRSLVYQLLTTIAKDNLFNAVLEDKRLTPPCKRMNKKPSNKETSKSL